MEKLDSVGLKFVLLTAFVSGFSIFLNKIAVSGSNPFVFTTLKNFIVMVFFLSLIFLSKSFSELKNLSLKQWRTLAIIGLVGGSIPFLLYFYGLSMASALSANFLHKSMFVFATIFAVWLLKEKFSKSFFIGSIFLLVANFLLFFKNFRFGFPESLILIATIFWAGESVVSKKALAELSPKIVSWGRMFFGSVFLIAFLVVSGNFLPVFSISAGEFFWAIVSAVLLFFYMFFWYNGLQKVPVSIGVSLLQLAVPITAMISAFYFNKFLALNEIIAFFLIAIASIFLIGLPFFNSIFLKTGSNV